jgi:hypothetical protein
MLDIEAFTYLNRALESPISPHVIFATNRGLCTIRGTENEPGSNGGEGIVSPHGVPIDLLDRCMIVRTMPYSRDEIKTVLQTRLKIEGLAIQPDALEKLSDDGVRTSLRCVSLGTSALILSGSSAADPLLLVSFSQIRAPAAHAGFHPVQGARPDRDCARRRRRDGRSLPRRQVERADAARARRGAVLAVAAIWSIARCLHNLQRPKSVCSRRIVL